MAIQFDDQHFFQMMQDERFDHDDKYGGYNEELQAYGDALILEAKKWFDSKQYLFNPQSKRAARIALLRYLREACNYNSPDNAWFVPSFIWAFIAKELLLYVIKLIIDYYWDDVVEENKYYFE
jgi:hypothetical protein